APSKKQRKEQRAKIARAHRSGNGLWRTVRRSTGARSCSTRKTRTTRRCRAAFDLADRDLRAGGIFWRRISRALLWKFHERRTRPDGRAASGEKSSGASRWRRASCRIIAARSRQKDFRSELSDVPSSKRTRRGRSISAAGRFGIYERRLGTYGHDCAQRISKRW